MEKLIYIGGDSYCFHRWDNNLHWPIRLANLLGLKLIGEGYPGRSWWSTRQDFNTHLSRLDDIEYVIFCHTNPGRINVRNYQTYRPNNNESDFYYEHFFDEHFHFFAMRQYYEELNSLLKNKKVIHLLNFRESLELFDLDHHGSICKTVLFDISFKDHEKYGGTIVKPPKNIEMYNHFLAETNMNIAQQLYMVCQSMPKYFTLEY